MKSQITSEVSDKLSLLVNETVKNIPDVDKIYLFGSYAYGTPHKNSDLDLMVITKKELDAEYILDKKVDIRYNIGHIVDDFDMIVYSAKIFNRRKKHYRLEKKIVDDGVLLYGKL